MSKEETILGFMKSLDISREEAEQLWEDDQADFIGEEGEEMTQKAKEIRRYEQADKPRKQGIRQIKEDTEKKEILELLLSVLQKNGYPAEIVSSKEIAFNEFSVSIVRHRQKGK